MCEDTAVAAIFKSISGMIDQSAALIDSQMLNAGFFETMILFSLFYAALSSTRAK